MISTTTHRGVYQSIANILSVVLFWAPNHSVTRKVGSESLEGLPGQVRLAIAGSVEVGPEEWGLVFGDLGRCHQPFRNLAEFDARLVCVMVGGDQVSMAEL